MKIIPALIFGVFFFICVASNISAQTLFVDRLDDADVSACTGEPNDCTLRGAINRANATTGSSVTILFDSRVFRSTSGFSALGFGSTGDLPVPAAFIN